LSESAPEESPRAQVASESVRRADAATSDAMSPLAASPGEKARAVDPSTRFTHVEQRNIIIGLMLAILLGGLDQTIVAVALPKMGDELNGFSLIAWVVSGYLVASTVVTPIYGKLGDLFGRRMLLSVSIVVFLVASIACAFAQTMPQLIVARVVQGLGGGGLISISQTIIADVVPLRERGRYQGYISAVFAVASVAGPVVGGLLTHYLSWRWIFWINLPLGAAAFFVSRRALVHLPVAGIRRRIDYVGAVLLMAGLTMLLIPITRIGQGVAWNDGPNALLFVSALVVLGVCLWHENRTAEPIIPITLLGIPLVASCCGILFLCFFQLVALSSLSPLRFEMVAGVTPDAAAWRLLPLTFTIPLGAFITGRLMLKTGRLKPQQVGGTLCIPLGLLGLAFTSPVHAILTAVLMTVVGLSIGIVMPSSLVAVQNVVPRHNMGVATAATAFSRSLGGAIGVALLSAILLASMHGASDGSAPAATGELAPRLASLTGASAVDVEAAFRKLFLFAAAVSCIAFVLALRLPDERLDAVH
jgi:EmrB/QacA subfamily drug resistance transporter